MLVGGELDVLPLSGLSVALNISKFCVHVLVKSVVTGK